MEDYIPYSNKFHKIYLCVEIRNFRKAYDYHAPLFSDCQHTIKAIAAINKVYTMGVKSYQDWTDEWNPKPEPPEEYKEP